MARTLNRMSFEQVRADERRRLRELEQIGRDYAQEGSVQTWFDDGSDPASVKADLDARVDANRGRAAASRIDPRAPAPERAAVAIALRLAGRVDLAERVESEVGVNRSIFHGVADGFGLIHGIQGSGVGGWVATGVREAFRHIGIVDRRRPLGVAPSEEARFALAMGDGTAGGLPASGLAPAVRSAVLMIVEDAWNRSGAFWRSCTREIEVTRLAEYVIYVARSGAVEVQGREELGAPVQSGGDGEDWPKATVQVERARFMASLRLSDERVVNVGLQELSGFIDAAAASWIDELDREVATVLGTAPVGSTGAALSSSGLAAAAAALNRQTVGGLTLGASKPVVLAGEGRRGLVYASGVVPSSAGDETALCSGARFSSAVPADFGPVLVHPGFMPLVMLSLQAGGLEPVAALGPAAGVMVEGRPTAYGARSQCDCSPITGLKVGTSIVGAVRMEVTP